MLFRLIVTYLLWLLKMAKVVIKNIDRLVKRLENIKTADLLPLVNKATLIVEAQAKELVPNDTGKLRLSIHPRVETKGKTIIGMVYTACEYAPYVEFGTGIKGSGTYPYDVKGLILSYRDTPWRYNDGERWWYSTGQIAQPFMYPALHLNKDKINKLMNNGYNELLRKSIGGG